MRAALQANLQKWDAPDHTFGFSFDRALLPSGNLSWIYNLMVECSNDTVGGMGSVQDVPEPSIVGSLALLGMILGGSELKRRKRSQAA